MCANPQFVIAFVVHRHGLSFIPPEHLVSLSSFCVFVTSAVHWLICCVFVTSAVHWLGCLLVCSFVCLFVCSLLLLFLASLHCRVVRCSILFSVSYFWETGLEMSGF